MPVETVRPALVDKYLRVRRVRLKAQAWEEEHKEELKEILRISNFDDIYLQNRTSKSPNIDVMEEWCKDNLTKEEAKKLYVSVLDPNALMELLKSGFCTDKGVPYPKNLFKVTSTEAIAERKQK